MNDFKTIPLKEIHADPNQPRKFYDEQAMEELVQSIEHKGVLSPILVRPNGKGYILVCGERRFRASKTAGLVDIPAVIRELNDTEALELQIIENLQRKDVHPMEEAVAFKSLIDHKQLSIEEIAGRIGKKPAYVKQRLKLNELTENWQKIFFRNGINITDALKVVALPAKHQEEVYKEEITKDDGHSKYSVRQYILDRYKGDLHLASFDLTDPFLDKKAGPCTTCSFNTAVNQLFPELTKPRCTNVSCFKHKTDLHFDLALKTAIEDPTIILIYDAYNTQGIVDKLRKEGHTVLREGYGEDCKQLNHADEEPVWESYLEDTEYETMSERKEAYENDLQGFKKQKAELDKKIATGKYKKAFMVYDQYGADAGKFVYVELIKKATSKAAKEAIESGSADASDIDEEIGRIRDREKRNKELDGEKIHSVVKNILSASTEFISDKRDCNLTQEEVTAAAVALFEGGSYEFKKWFAKQYKTGDYNIKPAEVTRDNGAKSHSISSLTYFGLNEIILHFIKDKLIGNGGSHLDSGNALAIHNIAKFYHPVEVKKAIDEQEAKAAKRAERAASRIKELQDQKKLLQAQAKKPAEKKAAKK
jgi:ParB family chromosome partitioning protein